MGSKFKLLATSFVSKNLYILLGLLKNNNILMGRDFLFLSPPPPLTSFRMFINGRVQLSKRGRILRNILVTVMRPNQCICYYTFLLPLSFTVSFMYRFFIISLYRFCIVSLYRFCIVSLYRYCIVSVSFLYRFTVSFLDTNGQMDEWANERRMKIICINGYVS